MKHLFISAALTAALVLAGCSKDSSGSAQEVDTQKQISFTNIVDKATKGYVTSDILYDTERQYLHDAQPTTTPREIQVSAYLTPQNGNAGNYFVGDTFIKDDNSSYWRRTPPIYWPIQGSLDFLAYSSKEAFGVNQVEWNEKNASSSVTLTLTGTAHLQDDILCASTQGTSTTGAGGVPMQFHHTQAWIQFRIKMKDASMNDKLAVESITMENIYSTGELTISRSDKEPSITWNFKHESKGNQVVTDYDGESKVYGGLLDEKSGYTVDNPITDKTKYLDMLIPPQAKTDIIINYMFAGQNCKLSYKHTLASGEWEAEKKYIYTIEFNISEVTFKPEVRVYESEDETIL